MPPVMRLFDITAVIRLPLCDRTFVKYFRSAAAKTCQWRYIYKNIRSVNTEGGRWALYLSIYESFQCAEKAEQTRFK